MSLCVRRRNCCSFSSYVVPRYDQLRIAYLSKVSEIVGSDVTVLPNDHLTHIRMYGSNVYNDVSNEAIIIETIQFIKKSERFKKLEAFDQ